jgi:TolA-binding protein
MRTIYLLITLLIMAACQGGGSAEEETVENAVKSNKEGHRILLAKIDSLEQIVYTDSFDVSKKSTSELMQAYLTFTEKYVGDRERAPKYLYKAAALSRAVNLPVKAIKLYDRILTDYPSYERAAEVAFLAAFTYDEDMQKPELAKEAYQEVIDKFPENKWAQQARDRLATIDLSDEELIDRFMKKNKGQMPSEDKSSS